MLTDDFKIFVDRLRQGNSAQIDEDYSPAFLDVDEKELGYQGKVHVKGEAYLAEQNLVFHLAIDAVARMPCLICNEPVDVPVHIGDFYHTEPLEAIKGGVFDMQEMLRENIILETPSFIECNDNQCKKREELQKYFKKKESGKEAEEDPGYQPFAHLE